MPVHADAVKLDTKLVSSIKDEAIKAECISSSTSSSITLRLLRPVTQAFTNTNCPRWINTKLPSPRLTICPCSKSTTITASLTYMARGFENNQSAHEDQDHLQDNSAQCTWLSPIGLAGG